MPGTTFERIKAALGEPFFAAEGVLLYHMDCLQGMRRLDANLIDLTVTSPPYNIGKSYEVLRPLPEYLDWCESWLKEVHRLTVPTGALWLNLGYLEISGFVVGSLAILSDAGSGMELWGRRSYQENALAA